MKWLPASIAIMTLLAVLTAGAASAQTPGLVETTEGPVQGTFDPATGVWQFKGIRYAAPPVGALRFARPEPPPQHAGTLLANLIGVHLLLPLAVLGAVLRGRTRGSVAPSRSPRLVALVVLATAYAYLAFFSSVGDYGENMRFRIGVEPLIWMITIVAAGELLASIRLLRAGATSS